MTLAWGKEPFLRDKYKLCTYFGNPKAPDLRDGLGLYWLSLSSTDLSSIVHTPQCSPGCFFWLLVSFSPLDPPVSLEDQCLFLMEKAQIPVLRDGLIPPWWTWAAYSWELRRTPGTGQAICARALMEPLLRLRTRCRWNFFKCNFNFSRAPMQQDPSGRVDGRTMIRSRTWKVTGNGPLLLLRSVISCGENAGQLTLSVPAAWCWPPPWTTKGQIITVEITSTSHLNTTITHCARWSSLKRSVFNKLKFKASLYVMMRKYRSGVCFSSNSTQPIKITVSKLKATHILWVKLMQLTPNHASSKQRIQEMFQEKINLYCRGSNVLWCRQREQLCFVKMCESCNGQKVKCIAMLRVVFLHFHLRLTSD